MQYVLQMVFGLVGIFIGVGSILALPVLVILAFMEGLEVTGPYIVAALVGIGLARVCYLAVLGIGRDLQRQAGARLVGDPARRP